MRQIHLCGALLAACVLLAGCPKPNPKPTNTPPTANAGGNITVPWGQTVVLHGSCTDPDPGDQAKLTYKWNLESWPPTSAVRPSDVRGADGPDAFFDADVAGDYVFSFKCNDGKVDSALATVTATVEPPPPNTAPTVDAGQDATIDLGDIAHLVAQGSDPDGDSLTYAWTIASAPAGSQLTGADIQGAATADATVTPDVAGAFVFEVAVDDGRGGTASGQVTLTVQNVVHLSGQLVVTVVDGETLAPIPGAKVAVGSAVATGVTDANGQLTYAKGGLKGPVDVTVEAPGTVSWDDDGDPSTPPITAPEYRLTTLTGFDRPAVTIAVSRTDAGARGGQKGTVGGAVPSALFDKLPAVDRMFSIAGAQMSGQLRVVLVAPILPSGDVTRVGTGDFLSPPLSPSLPLPGNMATDDAFLNENAQLLGRAPAPNGEPPFTLFQVPANTGKQRFFVLGGLATVDIARLLPLLVSGAGVGSYASETGIVLSAVDFKTLFVGVITVDVPAGGSVDIGSQLADPTTWDAFQTVDAQTAQAVDHVCDAQNNCVDLHRVRIFPSTTVTVTSGALPADPRLAAALPQTAPFEVFCKSSTGPVHCDPPNVIDLAVPPDKTTDGVPYGAKLVFLDLPVGHALDPAGGRILAGFRFGRAPGLDEATTVFGVPALSGTFSGLAYSASATAMRRVASRVSDGSLYLREGRSVAARLRLQPGDTTDLTSAQPFAPLPQLSQQGAGLGVEVLFEVQDDTVNPPIVVSATAMSVGPLPASSGPDLPSAVDLSAPTGKTLDVVTLASVDRSIAGGDVTPAVDRRWDILYPGGSTSLALPALPAGFDAPAPSGDEVWLEVSGYDFLGSFSYQQPDPAVLASRRRAVVQDAWSFRMP